VWVWIAALICHWAEQLDWPSVELLSDFSKEQGQAQCLPSG